MKKTARKIITPFFPLLLHMHVSTEQLLDT